MRAIIVDDEKLLREALKGLIKDYCPGVEIVGEANSVKSGKNVLEAVEFDVLFLDIKMRGGTGFDLLKLLEPNKRQFQIIITTAFDQYALKAIKESAVDYLLKPIDPDELVSAVKKVQENRNPSYSQYEKLLKLVLADQHSSGHISLATSERIHVVPLTDIIRCQSSNNYTYFYLKNDKRLLITKTLKEFESKLGQKGFLRVHQSHLVNTTEIKSYERQKGNFLLMSDGSEIPVSQSKRDELLSFLKHSMP